MFAAKLGLYIDFGNDCNIFYCCRGDYQHNPSH
ncbi:hypothetical protein CO2235_170158 [Cupriavidus oxalaticus]|uniref:Uncharacterized protein n=1 Tax=Cupriavidus oxalaticus TaxID=96344 RepID=A0A375FR43_9BURK|nr:hypothetical protein CO2235_U460002 [Cupriavidus oxalaticus]SPC13035.1 hypothetical protein CO2235_170158 [Cupriavidus oxalaticus]